MSEAIDSERFDASFSSYGPRGNVALSETHIDGLWKEAATITDDIAEQTWIVAWCVKAGRDAEWLKANRRTVGPLESLGLFEAGVMP